MKRWLCSAVMAVTFVGCKEKPAEPPRLVQPKVTRYGVPDCVELTWRGCSFLWCEDDLDQGGAGGLAPLGVCTPQVEAP